MYTGALLISQVLDIPFVTALIIMTAISVSFTAVGGLLAVVVTDTLQSFLMVAVCIRLYERYGTFDITEMRRLKG